MSSNTPHPRRQPSPKTRFRRLVASAIDGLPEDFRRRLDNVVFRIEGRRRGENPPRTLGFYHGVPLTGQSPAWATPQVFITLYQEPIERESRGDPAQLIRLVRHVVAHEVAHHFGFSDDDLRRMGVY